MPGAEKISTAGSSTDHLRHMLSVEHSFPTARIGIGILGNFRYIGYYWSNREVAPCRPHSRMLSKVFPQFHWRCWSGWRWNLGDLVVQHGWSGRPGTGNVYCSSSGDTGWLQYMNDSNWCKIIRMGSSPSHTLPYQADIMPSRFTVHKVDPSQEGGVRDKASIWTVVRLSRRGINSRMDRAGTCCHGRAWRSSQNLCC